MFHGWREVRYLSQCHRSIFNSSVFFFFRKSGWRKAYWLGQRACNMQHSHNVFQCFVESSFDCDVRHNDEFYGVLGDEWSNFGMRRQFFNGGVPTDRDTEVVACFQSIHEDCKAYEAGCSCDLRWFVSMYRLSGEVEGSYEDELSCHIFLFSFFRSGFYSAEWDFSPLPISSINYLKLCI